MTASALRARLVLASIFQKTVLATVLVLATGSASPTVSRATESIESSAPLSVQANLLANGDFSQPLAPSNWRIQDHNAVSQVEVVDGVLRMSPTGWVNQAVTVTAGANYTFTGYVRINQEFELPTDPAEFAGLFVLVSTATPNDSPNERIINSDAYSSLRYTVGAWNRISFGFTVPAGVQRIVITYRLFGKTIIGEEINTQMSADADNFTLYTDAADAPSEPTAALPAACSAAGNLLINGRFGQQLSDTGWQSFSDPSNGITSTPVVTNGELRFDGNGWVAQAFTTTPGALYYVSGWSKLTTVTTATAGTGLIFIVTREDNFATLNSTELFNTERDWRRSYFTFVAASTQTRLTFRTLGAVDLDAAGDDFVVSRCPIKSPRGGGEPQRGVMLPLLIR
jgi:hypothetical protein